MPCPHRYLINFLLDATVGMLLIYVGVRAVSILVEWQQWESLRFGEYGNSPRPSVGCWGFREKTWCSCSAVCIRPILLRL